MMKYSAQKITYPVFLRGETEKGDKTKNTRLLHPAFQPPEIDKKTMVITRITTAQNNSSVLDVWVSTFLVNPSISSFLPYFA